MQNSKQKSEEQELFDDTSVSELDGDGEDQNERLQEDRELKAVPKKKSANVVNEKRRKVAAELNDPEADDGNNNKRVKIDDRRRSGPIKPVEIEGRGDRRSGAHKPAEVVDQKDQKEVDPEGLENELDKDIGEGLNWQNASNIIEFILIRLFL